MLRYNRISRLGGGPFRPSGIYWDDGLSGQTAYGNIFIGVPGPSIMIGGGREITAVGNLIVRCDHAAIEYDDRYRDGYIHHGWAWRATQIPNGKYWRVLAQVPYTSTVWAERFCA